MNVLGLFNPTFLLCAFGSHDVTAISTFTFNFSTAGDAHSLCGTFVCFHLHFFTSPVEAWAFNVWLPSPTGLPEFAAGLGAALAAGFAVAAGATNILIFLPSMRGACSITQLSP